MAGSCVLLGCLWCASWLLRVCFSAASWVLLWWLWGAFGCSFEVPSGDQNIDFPMRKGRKIEDNVFFDTCFVFPFTFHRARCVFEYSGLLLVWFPSVPKDFWVRPKCKLYNENQMKVYFRNSNVYPLGSLVGWFLGAPEVPPVCFPDASRVLFSCFRMQ